MKKSNKIIIITACFLLILALCSTLLIEVSFASRVVDVITISTALVGAIALFFQFKRDKEINQASFILEYSKHFNETPGCIDIECKLNNYRLGKQVEFTELDNIHIVSYLEWCEELSILIQKGLMDLPSIDNLFAYKFFLIVNNEYVQKLELIPEAEFYKGIYALHKFWTKYKTKTNQLVLQESTDLSKVPNYEQYSSKGDFYNHNQY